MSVEVARVVCDECYKEIIVYFPEIGIAALEEKATTCVVFCHVIGLCAKHLRLLADKLEGGEV